MAPLLYKRSRTSLWLLGVFVLFEAVDIVSANVDRSPSYFRRPGSQVPKTSSSKSPKSNTNGPKSAKSKNKTTCPPVPNEAPSVPPMPPQVRNITSCNAAEQNQINLEATICFQGNTNKRTACENCAFTALIDEASDDMDRICALAATAEFCPLVQSQCASKCQDCVGVSMASLFCLLSDDPCEQIQTCPY